jgi:hypothetical protein
LRRPNLFRKKEKVEPHGLRYRGTPVEHAPA